GGRLVHEQRIWTSRLVVGGHRADTAERCREGRANGAATSSAGCGNGQRRSLAGRAGESVSDSEGGFCRGIGQGRRPYFSDRQPIQGSYGKAHEGGSGNRGRQDLRPLSRAHREGALNGVAAKLAGN